jgi:thiol-disulfide isomerase/thioredoxin
MVVIKKWSLKNIIKEIVTTLLILFVVSMVLNYIRKPDIKENIYTYELTDIKNNRINFDDYKSKPLLVHFWATWCPICKLEAANIERLSKEYNVITIAVNSGSDEELKAFMIEHELTYKVIHDQSGELAKKFNIEVYPTTLVYNKKGELKFTEVGYSTTLGLKARLELIN